MGCSSSPCNIAKNGIEIKKRHYFPIQNPIILDNLLLIEASVTLQIEKLRKTN